MHFSLILTFVYFTDMLGTFITLGDQYSLECLNDYKSSITCSLNISTESPNNRSLYWLHFHTSEDPFNCALEWRDQSLVCELHLSSDFLFTDTDSYTVSLHSGYHGNNFSAVLDGDYMPKHHMRPVAPCNLSLLWDQGGAVVLWESGYDPQHLLVEYLQYQLRLYSRSSVNYEVVVMEQKVFVEESRFTPHTSYTICVRSKPDERHYRGVWSQWTPVLHWSSGDMSKGSAESSFHPRYLLLVPISLLLLIGLSYFRCRRQEFIPSPASYLRDWKVDAQIHTLLSGKGRDIKQGEESVQINVLTENGDTPPQQSTLDYEMMGVTNEHEPTPQSPSMLHSPEGSEVDSGCWTHDVIKDYCILSHSQHTNTIMHV